jgi:hypothetical protein
VTQLDLVEEHEDYVPINDYGFKAEALRPEDLRSEEQHALTGVSPMPADADPDELVPQQDVW